MDDALNNMFEDEAMMKSRKVIVWGQDDLLSWAVNFFLTARKDWEVLSFSSDLGIDFLIRQVEDLRPDVVVVYQTKCVNSARMLMQLFYTRPELTMITVDPQENTMEVYNKKQILVKRVSDLISVVEGQYHPVH
ncbi:hypothetical protein [Candidatus Villigracilis saccharophilus]|uniref:hypothetical protein n=1 Tax=Candidatus Villigracilis saccharophilus TaxID=3140684 RepID=UPI003134D110|nr:hypothetical protein [Anaerolineales bacterium]